MNGKKALLAVLVIGLLGLTACKEGKNSGNGTPSETVTQAVTPAEEAKPTDVVAPTATLTPTKAIMPTATPTSTEVVTPTATPTPTVIFPEGFPKDVELKRAPKYTKEQIAKMLKDQAATKGGYLYKQTEIYSAPQEDFFVRDMDNYDENDQVKYSYDKEETYYEDDGPMVSAVIRYLNGKQVYAYFTSKELNSYLREFDGKQYVHDNYTGETVTKTDEAGREILVAEYNTDGYLTRVMTAQYDEAGRLLEEASFSCEPRFSRYIPERMNRYTYDEVGNVVRKEVSKRRYEQTYSYSEKTVREKDSQGRVIVSTVTRSGAFSEENLSKVSKTFWFYNEDGSVLEVAADESEEELYAELCIPCDKNREMINKGVEIYPLESEDTILKGGLVRENADGKYEFVETWLDTTYENGLLVHTDIHNQGSFECTYEYDNKQRVIRCYGSDGSDGPFDIRYVYDEKGIRTTSVEKEAWRQYSDDTLTDEERYGEFLTTITTQYTYDKNGNKIGEDLVEDYRGKTERTLKKSFDAAGNTVREEEIYYIDDVKVQRVYEKIQ